MINQFRTVLNPFDMLDQLPLSGFRTDCLFDMFVEVKETDHRQEVI